MASSLLRFLKHSVTLARVERVAPWHQWQDLRFFRRVTGMSPGEFHRYRLWDRRRSLAERLEYLSHKEHRVIEGALNPRDAVRALNDKLMTARRLAAAGIGMPRVVGTIEGMSAANGAPNVTLVAQAIREMLTTHAPGGLVFKPNRGQGGRGMEVFVASSPAGLQRPDGSVLSVDAVAGLIANRPSAQWKVEEWLTPHPALAAFAPYSLSSVRVFTFRAKDGSVHVGPAALKIPVDDRGIDNFGAGNLAAPIELATGRVGRAVYSSGPGFVDLHPRTGAPITGTILPQIAEVVTLTTAAALAVGELTVLGWDIALTAGGPCVLEGNAWWSEAILQLPHGRGLVQGRFAELLREYGLEELLEARGQ